MEPHFQRGQLPHVLRSCFVFQAEWNPIIIWTGPEAIIIEDWIETSTTLTTVLIPLLKVNPFFASD